MRALGWLLLILGFIVSTATVSAVMRIQNLTMGKADAVIAFGIALMITGALLLIASAIVRRQKAAEEQLAREELARKKEKYPPEKYPPLPPPNARLE